MLRKSRRIASSVTDVEEDKKEEVKPKPGRTKRPAASDIAETSEISDIKDEKESAGQPSTSRGKKTEIPAKKVKKRVKKAEDDGSPEDHSEQKIEPEELRPEARKAKKRADVACESDVQKNMRLTIGAQVLDSSKGSKKFLGVHVSAASGLENAIYNARAEGCRSFAMFVRNQRTWNVKPMEQSVVDKWHSAVKETGYDLAMVLPHGSYLMNPGCPDAVKLAKTREAMLDECRRSERLGIKLYNFHPGSTIGACTVQECIKTIAETINYIIENTAHIVLVIETMAGQGNTIGGKFEEIKDMIDLVKDQTRVGVCIDTCHIFAAGYDMRTAEAYDATMQKFEDVIGLKYLKAFHINDSKGDLGCKTDRHEHIGLGKIGLEGFRCLMNDARLNGIPMVLETPEGDYPAEMTTMYGLDKECKSSK